MPISVTINRTNRNRKYNSNMTEVRFLKSDVVNSSNNTSVDRAILSKFGFERDLNIAKQMLLLKPKPGVDFQLRVTAIFKI